MLGRKLNRGEHLLHKCEDLSLSSQDPFKTGHGLVYTCKVSAVGDGGRKVVGLASSQPISVDPVSMDEVRNRLGLLAPSCGFFVCG